MTREASLVGEKPNLLRVVDGGRESDPSEPSDADLIDALERGEGRACVELYDRLVGVVEGSLYRVLGRRDDSHDDLVQAAFEQIVLTLSKNRFSRACSLRSWAATVTTHVAFNSLRSRTRERKVVDRGRDGEVEARIRHSNADVEREATVREALDRVRFHLAAMDRKHAMTLFLHDVEGHELAEIAVLTSVSVAAAQSRLVRARKELQRRLSEERPSFSAEDGS
ncbi:MAG TPA: RNA polymerase sigma factor [Polyangiaceae bacterium]|jgi:RNA polymerase sigma-70 factor (ECF subfamily)|nr:RNA polymerase sigma factor [Polyangiaceae bacterium]